MLISRFVIVFAASAVACAVTTLGILIISWHQEWSRERSAYFVSFAAGVLITVSFMHLIPESMEMSGSAPVFLLLGFLALFLLNRFLKLYLCHEYECEEGSGHTGMGVIPLLGIGLHSLIDGAIFAVTFNVSVFTEVLTAIGMAFHEFPEGVISFVLLEQGGLGPRKSRLYAFLAAGLSTPLGAVIAYPFVRQIEQATLGALLALAAGALVYVGATHLLPEIAEQNRRYTVLALAVGVISGLVIIVTKG